MSVSRVMVPPVMPCGVVVIAMSGIMVFVWICIAVVVRESARAVCAVRAVYGT